MSPRRCASGMRARIVHPQCCCDGHIVVILRPYEGEVLGRFSWTTETAHAWVVLSLSGPMDWVAGKGDNLEGADLLAAVDDKHLEPLDDADDGLRRAASLARPVRRSRAVAAVNGRGMAQESADAASALGDRPGLA